MLTLVLLRLEARMEEFCALVANPTTANVSAAAELLERCHSRNAQDLDDPTTVTTATRGYDVSTADAVSSLSAPNSRTFHSGSYRLSPTLSKIKEKKKQSIFISRRSSRMKGKGKVVDFVSLSPTNENSSSRQDRSSKSPSKTPLSMLKSALYSPMLLSQRALSSMVSMSDRPTLHNSSRNRIGNQREGSWFMSPVLSKYKHGYLNERMIEENEWQEFTSPFLILAGCEAVFARMDHVCSSSDKILLERYNEILDSFRDVTQLLCNPLLRESAGTTPQSRHGDDECKTCPSSSSFIASSVAFSLSKTVTALENLIRIRMKQVTLHRRLFFTSWTSEESDYDDSILLNLANDSKAVQEDLSNMLIAENALYEGRYGAIHPIIHSSLLESTAFTFALMAYSSVHKCL